MVSCFKCTDCKSFLISDPQDHFWPPGPISNPREMYLFIISIYISLNLHTCSRWSTKINIQYKSIIRLKHLVSLKYFDLFLGPPNRNRVIAMWLRKEGQRGKTTPFFLFHLQSSISIYRAPQMEEATRVILSPCPCPLPPLSPFGYNSMSSCAPGSQFSWNWKWLLGGKEILSR